jgi:hypothetical protein
MRFTDGLGTRLPTILRKNVAPADEGQTPTLATALVVIWAFVTRCLVRCPVGSNDPPDPKTPGVIVEGLESVTDGKTSATSFREIAEGVAKEFVGASLTLLSIYAIRKLVELLLGKELLWDFLPIRYCADTVDLAVFARFLWQVIRTFND